MRAKRRINLLTVAAGSGLLALSALFGAALARPTLAAAVPEGNAPPAAAAKPTAPSTVTEPPPEPPALPSGLELLYGDRLALNAAGEPLVPMGILSGEDGVVMRVRAPVRLDFFTEGVHKQSVLQPDTTLTLSIQRAERAKRRHYVDLEGVARSNQTAVARAKEKWQRRGLRQVELLEEGTVLGIGGQLLDNRDWRIVLPCPNQAEAKTRAAAISERFGVPATARTRLLTRPSGQIALHADDVPLGTATAYVRLSPLGAAAAQATVQIEAVEFAKGYAWHGRESRRYEGEIYGVVDADGHLAVVNVVGIEKILAGVVPSEIFASAPPEALKAQAVAARNILLAKLGRRHHEDPFRLCSEQHCQVYTGLERQSPSTTAAVRATTGEALFLDGRLLDAVYSSTCGGHTENNDAAWGDKADAALRGRPDFDRVSDPTGALANFANGITNSNMAAWLQAADGLAQPPQQESVSGNGLNNKRTYCSRAPQAKSERLRWRKTVPADALQRTVAAEFPHMGKLRRVVVEERGISGRVVRLSLVGEHGQAGIEHELTIRRFFGGLHSAAFTVQHQFNDAGELAALTFDGVGWGHGVGMCQLGAIGRAAAGHSYEKILAHYYNGARLLRLYGEP